MFNKLIYIGLGIGTLGTVSVISWKQGKEQVRTEHKFMGECALNNSVMDCYKKLHKSESLPKNIEIDTE